MDKIIEIAKNENVCAIHPGFIIIKKDQNFIIFFVKILFTKKIKKDLDFYQKMNNLLIYVKKITW